VVVAFPVGDVFEAGGEPKVKIAQRCNGGYFCES
jgi:hypothetical protein